jgi:hypothetical protein
LAHGNPSVAILSNGATDLKIPKNQVLGELVLSSQRFRLITIDCICPLFFAFSPKGSLSGSGEQRGTKAINSPPIPPLRLIKAASNVKGKLSAQLPNKSVSIRSEKYTVAPGYKEKCFFASASEW